MKRESWTNRIEFLGATHKGKEPIPTTINFIFIEPTLKGKQITEGMRKVPQRITEVSSSDFKTLGAFVCQSSVDEVGESCWGCIITESNP